MRSYYDLKCTVYLCSARVGSSWWNLWKKDIPIWVFNCWNAIRVLQWDKCQTEVSKCYDLDQHSYWVLFFIFRSFTAIIVPNFGFAKTHGKWLVLVHHRAQLEMLNLVVLSNWLRLNTVDHLNLDLNISMPRFIFPVPTGSPVATRIVNLQPSVSQCLISSFY